MKITSPVEIDLGGIWTTITPSDRGNVEIEFAEKPPADLRQELKAHRFWYSRRGYWWGFEQNLPRAIAEAISQEIGG